MSENPNFPPLITDAELNDMREWSLSTGDGPSVDDWDRIICRIKQLTEAGRWLHLRSRGVNALLTGGPTNTEMSNSFWNRYTWVRSELDNAWTEWEMIDSLWNPDGPVNV